MGNARLGAAVIVGDSGDGDIMIAVEAIGAVGMGACSLSTLVVTVQLVNNTSRQDNVKGRALCKFTASISLIRYDHCPVYTSWSYKVPHC